MCSIITFRKIWPEKAFCLVGGSPSRELRQALTLDLIVRNTRKRDENRAGDAGLFATGKQSVIFLSLGHGR